MVIRELQLMIQLSKMDGNIYTTKIHNVVLGGDKDSFESLFIIMDYVDQDLHQMIQDETMEFEFEHALTILYNALCGLNFLKSANVIHRDIKP